MLTKKIISYGSIIDIPTYEVLIDGEKKTFRAESEESARKKAQTYCIATGNRKAVIQVIGIAP